jgi:hypothetical protein
LLARFDAGQVDGSFLIAWHALKNRTVAIRSRGITPGPEIEPGLSAQ